MGGCGSNPLPVELTTFSGALNSNGDAILNWSTASEKNSDYYQVERSTNGMNFNHIGKVYAAGNSNEELSYTFKDDFSDIKSIASSQLYYRIKQVDVDGLSQTFDPVVLTPGIKFLSSTARVENGFLKFNWVLKDKSILNVNLFDVSGRSVIDSMTKHTDGPEQMELALGNISKGTYILQVNDNRNNNFSSKLIIQ